MTDAELEFLDAYEIIETICIDAGSMYSSPKFLRVRVLTQERPA